MGLDAVEILIAVEEQFGVVFSDEDAAACETVSDLHVRVISKLRAKGDAADQDTVFVILREIIVAHLGVRADEVIPSAHFIRDLGLN